jgi:thioredoxin
MPIDLTSENFAQIVTSESNVIIDFTAKWCGPCKRMAPEYDATEAFVKTTGIDLIFAKVDVDDQEELAQEFGIKCMPTLVLIKNGTEVERSLGASDKAKLLKLIGKHFDMCVDCADQSCTGGCDVATKK